MMPREVSWLSIAHSHRNQLIRAYNRFNRLYWSKTLPPSSKIYFHLIPAGQLGEVMTCQDLGGCSKADDGRFVIEVRWQVERGFRYLCLLHEMVHMSLWDEEGGVGHGKVFMDEVNRIAQLGAMAQVI